jgi:hypothetical protein
MLVKYIRYFLKEYAFTLFAIFFVAAYWISAHKLPFAAIQYPMVVSVIAVFFIIWNIIMSVLEFNKVYYKEGNDKEKYDISFGLNKTRLITIGATVAYVILMPFLGYVITTFIYMGLLSWFLGAKKPLRIIVFSALVTAAFYAIFRLWLHARLPVGFFI